MTNNEPARVTTAFVSRAVLIVSIAFLAMACGDDEPAGKDATTDLARGDAGTDAANVDAHAIADAGVSDTSADATAGVDAAVAADAASDVSAPATEAGGGDQDDPDDGPDAVGVDEGDTEESDAAAPAQVDAAVLGPDVMDAGADGGPSDPMCEKVCAAKLATECATPQPLDVCLSSCLALYTGPCGTQAKLVDKCALAETDNPWICLGGQAVLGTDECVNEQAALILCSLP